MPKAVVLAADVSWVVLALLGGALTLPSACGAAGGSEEPQGTGAYGAGCPGGWTDCDGICADLERDSANCGSCAHACGIGLVCSAGHCVCPEPLERCDDQCVDLREDPAHCGECERRCPAEDACTGGLCRSSVSSGPPLNDWDGDGTSDLGVFHPEASAWYIRMSGADQALLPFGFAWGPANAVPVPGRYDDSGLPTLALYHPVSGQWHVRLGNGQEVTIPLGHFRSQPIAGDFTGNGVSDICVVDQSTYVWNIRTVSGDVVLQDLQFGYEGTIPVAGDFDGDGRFDLAVYDPRDGRWFVTTVEMESLAHELPWGGPGMEPVPGDYDGDGKWDLGVYEPLTGFWYVRSVDEERVIAWELHWGFERPLPVPGDYEGVGRFNPALYDQYDPEGATWYVALLDATPLEGFMGLQYGWDRAVPISLTRLHLPIQTGGDGFLYKPRVVIAPGHYEGRVVLLPARMRPDGATPVYRAVIAKDPMGTSIMEELRYTGDHGDRPKWRWSENESLFGHNFYVVAFFAHGGPPQPYLIADGEVRQE